MIVSVFRQMNAWNIGAH